MDRQHGLPAVEQKWKEADAEAMQERINAIDYWLAHTENILEMLSQDEAISNELRGAMGRLKSRKGDLQAEIDKLTFR